MTAAARRLRLAAALVAVGSAGPARACAITTLAQIDLGAVNGERLAAVTIDGRQAVFVLDTGAQRTLLSGAGYAALGLKPDEWTSTALKGIGGVERHRDAAVGRVMVGSVELARRGGPVRSLPVAETMPGRVSGLEIDGLLGADLLGGHEVELQDRARTMLLHGISGCAGRFVPWAEDAVGTLLAPLGLMVIPVRLGGRELSALIDTGAQISIVGEAAAARLGVTAASLRDAPSAQSGGIGRNAPLLHEHDFGALTIGRVPVDGLPLWVGPLPTGGFDMVLGMDRLSALRLWLSYGTGQVFIARIVMN